MHSSVVTDRATPQRAHTLRPTVELGERRHPRSAAWPVRRLLALIVGAAIIVGLSLVAALDPAAAPARAATTGAGYPGITPYGGYLGNYVAPDGTRVYCIDANLDWPSGSTSGGTVVTSLATSWGAPVDDTTLRKLNYALLVWGQTDDRATAAAVSAYLYAYTSGYARTHGAGYDSGAYYINGERAVLAAYDVIWSQSETQYQGPVPVVAVDVQLSGREGIVSVSVDPPDAPATLTITGATITGGTTTSTERAAGDSTVPGAELTTAQVTDGATVTVLADATEGEISVTADLAVNVSGGAAPSVVLYETPGQQRTVRGSTHGSAEGRAHDSASTVIAIPAQLAETGLTAQPESAVGAAAVTVVGALLAAGTTLARARRSQRRFRALRSR